MQKPKLKDFAIIGQFADGKYRQILIKDDTKTSVLQLIQLLEPTFNIVDKPIESINFTENALTNE